ncbi:MAG TPA: hotdog domain-containing protein, partial [Actinomycetota bacterium]|nr:hotdog domain-containing protein [Actinomycetota bacterium]
MPPASVTVRRRIMWFDTDASTKYHNTAPLRLMEEAEAALLDGVGLVKEVYGWLPRAHVTVDYRRPVRFWDEVEVSVRVREVGRSSITYGF